MPDWTRFSWNWVSSVGRPACWPSVCRGRSHLRHHDPPDSSETRRPRRRCLFTSGRLWQHRRVRGRSLTRYVPGGRRHSDSATHIHIHDIPDCVSTPAPRFHSFILFQKTREGSGGGTGLNIGHLRDLDRKNANVWRCSENLKKSHFICRFFWIQDGSRSSPAVQHRARQSVCVTSSAQVV